MGRPWVSSGWDYAFIPGTTPSGFTYEFYLSGKGNGKNKEVMAAIESMLTGYTKDADQSSESELFYQNAKQVVKITSRSNRVAVVISEVEVDEARGGDYE
ncbi:MAG: hypothetical protein O3C32_07585 [Bacteroidetes bacterium]|nr:hypothetical protein [Bacteroidota bacterium]